MCFPLLRKMNSVRLYLRRTDLSSDGNLIKTGNVSYDIHVFPFTKENE